MFFSPGVHRAARKAAPFSLQCTQTAWHSQEEGTDPWKNERNSARCLQLLCNDTHYRASLNKHPGNGLQSTTVRFKSVRGGGEGAALGFAERLHLTSAHLVEASPVAARRQLLLFILQGPPPPPPQVLRGLWMPAALISHSSLFIYYFFFRAQSELSSVKFSRAPRRAPQQRRKRTFFFLLKTPKTLTTRRRLDPCL